MSEDTTQDVMSDSSTDTQDTSSEPTLEDFNRQQAEIQRLKEQLRNKEKKVLEKAQEVEPVSTSTPDVSIDPEELARKIADDVKRSLQEEESKKLSEGTIDWIASQKFGTEYNDENDPEGKKYAQLQAFTQDLLKYKPARTPEEYRERMASAHEQLYGVAEEHDTTQDIKQFVGGSSGSGSAKMESTDNPNLSAIEKASLAKAREELQRSLPAWYQKTQ